MKKMLRDMSWSGILNALVGRGKSKRPRNVHAGDVVCVEDGLWKRYGIYTGDGFIQYAADETGNRVVHQVSFQGFFQGAEHCAVCEFPERYGHPTEWDSPIPSYSSVVMPQEKLWRMIAQGRKARKYKRYSPKETVERAKSRIGDTDFATSEHFAMWCKTGIAESHRLEKMQEWWDMVVVY